MAPRAAASGPATVEQIAGGRRRARRGARARGRDRRRLVDGRDHPLARADRPGRRPLRRRGGDRHDRARAQRRGMGARPFRRSPARRAAPRSATISSASRRTPARAIFAQPVENGARALADWASFEFARNDPATIASLWASLVRQDVRALLERIAPSDARRPRRAEPALRRGHRRPSRRRLARRQSGALRPLRPRAASRAARIVQRHRDRVRGPPVARPRQPDPVHEEEYHVHAIHFADQPQARQRHRSLSPRRLRSTRRRRPSRSCRPRRKPTAAPAARTSPSPPGAPRKSLQRVPGSVSAFNERALERIQAQDPTGLQGAVPNLNIVQGRGSSNAMNIFIRGIGQPDALQTFDPGGRRLCRRRLLQPHPRHPVRPARPRSGSRCCAARRARSTARTRSAARLSFVTRRPGDELRGEVMLTYGTYNQMEARGIVSGPLTEGVSAGIAVLHAERDGYVEDPVLDRDYNDKNTEAVRGHLALDADRNVRIDITADYSRGRRPPDRRPAAELADLPDRRRRRAAAADQSERLGLHRRAPRRACPTRPSLDHWGVAMNAALDVTDALTLALDHRLSRSRDRRLRRHRRDPARDGRRLRRRRPEPVQPGIPATYTRDRLTGVAGLYYLREHITSHQEAYADDLIGPLLGNPTFLRTIDDDLVTTSYAAYANLSFEVVPTVRISAGAPLHPREQGLFPHHLDLLAALRC